MNIIEKILNPDKWFGLLGRNGFFKSWDNEKYLKRMYKAISGRELDLNNHVTFSEKLQKLKIIYSASENLGIAIGLFFVFAYAIPYLNAVR